MKKREGFTLVELMAVIAILAIILAIVVPKVFKSIDDSKVRACKIQMDYIVDAAATYFTKYRYNEVKDVVEEGEESITYDEKAKSENGVDIKLIDLVNASLLKGTIENPITSKELVLENTKVNIKNDEDGFKYTILISEDSFVYEQLICK